jgi:hypothetical protein
LGREPFRNSFTGLVELNRFRAGRERWAVRQATIQQTMPGSVRQSARLPAQPDPPCGDGGRAATRDRDHPKPVGAGPRACLLSSRRVSPVQLRTRRRSGLGVRVASRVGPGAVPKLLHRPRRVELFSCGTGKMGSAPGNDSTNDAWLSQTIGPSPGPTRLALWRCGRWKCDVRTRWTVTTRNP